MRGKRKMLGFTCCVIFFNCIFTFLSGGAALTRLTNRRPGKRSAAGHQTAQTPLRDLLLLIVLVIHPGVDNQGQHQDTEHHAQ